MRLRAVPAWLLALGLVAGCAGPRPRVDPVAPAALDGVSFVHADAALAGEVLAEGWWRSFGDPALDALVERAVRENLDLQRAAARVAEVKASLVETRAAERPAVTAGASAERARSAVASPFADRVSNRYSLSLGFSYELDLWGRVANLTAAAVEDVEAAEADRHRAYQALVADVVRTYVSIRLARETLDLTERTTENDRRRLALVESRSRRGLAPAVDVYQARQRVAQAESRIYVARQTLEQARHQLNVLLGGYPARPEGERVEPAPLTLPAAVPVGVPLALVARRPDLAAARSRYRAASARVGVAEAERLPRLALTGAAGRTSDLLSDLTEGGRTFWSLLGNLTAPLYTAGARKAAVTRAEARLDQARLAYGAALLEALRQVEDVLVAESAQRDRDTALERSVQLARKALDVAEDRYRRGLEDLTRTLSARNTLFSAELEQLATRRTLLLNRVALYLALGGSWGLEELLPADAGTKEKS